MSMRFINKNAHLNTADGLYFFDTKAFLAHPKLPKCSTLIFFIPLDSLCTAHQVFLAKITQAQHFVQFIEAQVAALNNPLTSSSTRTPFDTYLVCALRRRIIA